MEHEHLTATIGDRLAARVGTAGEPQEPEGNLGTLERVVSGVVGAVLTGRGILHGGLLGLGVAGVGAALLARGVSGRSFTYAAAGRRRPPPGPEEPLEVLRTVTVLAEPEALHDFWRDLTHLTVLFPDVRELEVRPSGVSRWVAEGPGGREVHWHAEITEEAAGHHIFWRTLEDSDVQMHGSVRFEPAPGDRGTEVTVRVEWQPPYGLAGAAWAAWSGRDPEHEVGEALRRLKQLFEAGEIATIEGQPAARRETRPTVARMRQVFDTGRLWVRRGRRRPAREVQA